MARPRKQTYTLEMYLKKNKKGDIDNNADVQRNFVWNKEQINELVVTVLTDDYIPPIILGEEEDSKLHIVDGGCRTAALRKFREMNYKITSVVENALIPYKRKYVDEEGNILYEDAVFDIRNKTFERLPIELQEKFDEYQIETVIHECCDGSRISKYIKRYNNHVSMNPDQRAFTYIDRFASRIRKLVDSRFFVECSSYTEKERTKGAVERVVVETIMCTNHFDHWKTQPKAACKYLNEHAREEEFDRLADNLRRLEHIVKDDMKEIFNKKDSFIFLTLFDKFTDYKTEDIRFAEFLSKFQLQLRGVRKNEKGLLFDEIDRELSTKDRQVVADKLAMLETLLAAFLHEGKGREEEQADGLADFIAENLGMSRKDIQADMDLYTESLDVLLDDTVKIGSKIRSAGNRPSLLAMMVYSYKEDKDLDEWMAVYAGKHTGYLVDQRKNFQQMRADFERFLAGKG
ncbi:MAG: DUF262 domain-containing protein [Lachnospiraceae bacterium]|nr:DUF262 domain-containing protein [Lachnospiraceae bacterium]